jgi:hypothetical protein
MRKRQGFERGKKNHDSYLAREEETLITSPSPDQGEEKKKETRQ